MTSRKHTWTPAQVTTLLQEYRHHIGNGKAAGSGLKMTEWTAITTSFNKTYKTSATEQTLKNKLQVEKQRYNLCVKAAGDLTMKYVPQQTILLQDKAKAAKARDVITNGVPNFDLLKELFGHSIPSGNNARSSTQTSAPRSSPRRQSKGTASTIQDEDEDSEDGGDKGADEGDVDDEGDQDAASARCSQRRGRRRQRRGI
ncbi:hypothetical protein HDU79_011789 [Rhizoclosmatium sp. JEL0117]|nr:hypothetical protein HDU79_011789 [Rhizoclosmatium sp. JEL0117]